MCTFLLEPFRGVQQGVGTRQLCSAIPHPLGSCESRHSCPASLGRAIPCAALSRDSDSHRPSGDTAASAPLRGDRAAAELGPARQAEPGTQICFHTGTDTRTCIECRYIEIQGRGDELSQELLHPHPALAQHSKSTLQALLCTQDLCCCRRHSRNNSINYY